ncbi:MAG: ribonuclease D, partial [Eggerthellaceae bacterium]|nr:ribonuclease D [Eggerthellaceae bacterium]
MYISSQDELDEFIASSAGCKILAIDTEFMRERTYRPQLCLLQLATENDVVL